MKNKILAELKGIRRAIDGYNEGIAMGAFILSDKEVAKLHGAEQALVNALDWTENEIRTELAKILKGVSMGVTGVVLPEQKLLELTGAVDILTKILQPNQE